MNKTPLDFLISHIREQWLYKDSHFIYPYEFGTENEEIADKQGEYYCKCIIVEKDHSTSIDYYHMKDLFDALFINTDKFKFLQSIEAKHKLLQ